MSYICDSCLEVFSNSVEIQKDFLQSFNLKYFGANGIKSTEVLHESTDCKWKGLSINLLLDYAKKCNFDINVMKEKMNDPAFIEEGKDMFLDLYNQYRQKCGNTKWSVFFNSNNNDITQTFVSLKKDMMHYIMQNIPHYYDDTSMTYHQKSQLI